jgi:hypothetical protein
MNCVVELGQLTRSHILILIHHYDLTKFVTKSHILNKRTLTEHKETTQRNPQIHLGVTIYPFSAVQNIMVINLFVTNGLASNITLYPA